MPFTVISLPAVTPPVPLSVKLFTPLVKKVVGSEMAEVFAKIRLAEALLTSTVPPLLPGELPEMVNVFAPTVNIPDVKANVPATFTSPPKVIPFERFMVRLFRDIAGKLVLAPEPPKTRLELAPPVNEPEVLLIAPFSVKVLAPIVKVPLAKVSVCSIARFPPNIKPLLLLSVKPSIVLLTNDPDGIF